MIVVNGWSQTKVTAFRLMVNRSANWAEWDEQLLALELQQLQLAEFDLTLTGFDQRELEELLATEAMAQGLTDEDALPAIPESPVSVTGDIWLLGDHQLLVGDATDQGCVDRLMAGKAADLLFLDPPYGVDYRGYTQEHLTIRGDRMSDADFKEFLEAAFRSCRRIVKPKASVYVCHSSSRQREFENALEAAGFEVRCQIIWAKNTFAWGFGRYKFQHEPLFYAHVSGEKDAWYGNKAQSTLWAENKPAANRIHPTTKPVELIERALINSSKLGDLLVDLFAGSAIMKSRCPHGRSPGLCRTEAPCDST